MLLRTIMELQNLIGLASGLHGNDRNPNGFEKGQDALKEAFDLCIEAQRFDNPSTYEGTNL
jgi:hypothetical protein